VCLSCTYCYADELLLNQRPFTVDLSPVNIQPYSTNPEDNNHPVINKLMASPLRFILLPLRNGFGFLFQIRF